jgi:multiple sugar transport system permease protein
MFTSPALLFIGLVTLFPIGFSVLLSFENVNVTANGFSLNGLTTANYSLVLGNSTWHYALGFTVGYTIVTVLAEVILGTLMALILERMVAGRGWMMALLLIPWSLVTVISAKLWAYIYDPTFGIADGLFHALGLGNPVILGSNASAIIALMVADVWKTTPFVAIIVLAGLVMLPQEIYEAAEVDGATGWTTFWKITFPLLRPTIALAVLFRVLQAFGLFDLPFVLTQGGPGTATTSLAVLGYNATFNDYKYGPGAAVATTTAVLVVLGCFAFLKVFRSQVGEEEVG